MDALQKFVRAALANIELFARVWLRRALRPYQARVARAIVESVIYERGHTFAVMFPRQSGKNETQAHIEAYLLNIFRRIPGAQIVKASPTFKPQTINSMLRLETLLNNTWNAGQWARRQGYIIQLGSARILFFSAEPSANVVGATASILLVCDEAQDVDAAKWDKDFKPMAASTNATTVYFGTAWTDSTLLAREIAALKQLERKDGIQRVFAIPPEEVASANPAYGRYLAGEIARLGRQHPLIKTQYFLETIGDAGGLFPAERRARMEGAHARQERPAPGAVYGLLIDVAGSDESDATTENDKRDSFVLTVVEADLSTLQDPLLEAPTFRVARRWKYTNLDHTLQYATARDVIETWQPRYCVVDATGLGGPLADFLQRAYGLAADGGRILPFTFTSASKSQLGWDFVGLVDSGRWKDHAADTDPLRAQFWRELEACTYSVQPGPARLLRWSVELKRDPLTSEWLHDDLLMSAALTAILDQQQWSFHAPGTLIKTKDPLEELSSGY